MQRPETIKLNVGGKILETRRDTLRLMPMLDRMMDFPTEQDPSEPVFLDRDPVNFEILLNIARGWPTTLVENLPVFQQKTLRVDADYLGMGLFPPPKKFHFRLAQSNPYAMITNHGTTYTIGNVGVDNTVFGDQAVPQTGRTYWEVTIVKKGQSTDCIGLALQSLDPRKILDSDGGWSWRTNADHESIFSINSEDIIAEDRLPTFASGMCIGVDVDMNRGSLSFWVNSEFIAVVATNLGGKVLFPAFSVYGGTIMQVRSGMQPPDLVGSAPRASWAGGA